MRPGTIANRSGKNLEFLVVTTFGAWGIKTVLNHKDWIKNPIRPAIVKNFPLQSIYGHNSKSEFVIVLNDPAEDIRIECKWQAVGGSVDEKFPYLLACLILAKEKKIIILLDGGGAKSNAVDWLKQNAKKASGKVINVFNMSEFTAYVQHEFKNKEILERKV